MEALMQRIPKAVYTKEFCEEAVKLLMTDGVGALKAARRLLISMKTLANWVRAGKAGTLESVGQYHKPLTEAELGRVKRESAEVKMDRDLLKKFATVLRERVAVRYGVIEQVRQQYQCRRCADSWACPPVATTRGPTGRHRCALRKSLYSKRRCVELTSAIRKPLAQNG
jgi:transposase